MFGFHSNSNSQEFCSVTCPAHSELCMSSGKLWGTDDVTSSVGLEEQHLNGKPLGGISGGSKELRFFMSQHRKNSARGKVVDKK